MAKDGASGSKGLQDGAVITDDGEHRLLLTRVVSAELTVRRPDDRVLFIGLNPSKADATEDDHTIRKMKGFAARWGIGVLHVANLFTRRATRPEDMYAAADPGVDVLALWLMMEYAARCQVIVLCWGSRERKMTELPGGSLTALRENFTLRGRASEVCRSLALNATGPVMCLGVTKGGHPWHPARLPYGTLLENFDASVYEPAARA